MSRPLPRAPEDWEACEEIAPATLADLERRIARRVSRWELGGPAILVLESMKPVSYIASQFLVFAQPIVQSLIAAPDYYAFRKLLEDRAELERLILAIEADEEHRLGRASAARERRAWATRACRLSRAVRLARAGGRKPRGGEGSRGDEHARARPS